MEQHINNFFKGLNSDFQLTLQPDNTYRYLKNCQLISQDGNNYTIKDCLGNTRIFRINIPYATFTAGTPNVYTYQTPPMVIGFLSFPDKLIVLSTNYSAATGGGYGEIGMITYAGYGQGIQPTDTLTDNLNEGYTPLYHSANLNFSQQHRVEGFTFPENEITESIYWTDYFNEPRTFNIANPIFTTYSTPAAGNPTSLVVGQQYMVLEGVIEHPVLSTVYYGPGLSTGNVFTASSTSYTDKSTPSPASLVIGYFPYQLLAFTPSRALGNMKFNSYGTGQLYCGNKIYFYRLGRASDNYRTSWSYGSSPIHVGTTNSESPVVPNNYENFVGGGTTTTLLITATSVKIDISNIDTNFDIIEVACAEYDNDISTPRQITMIESTTVTGSSMTIEHTGSINLGTITLSQLTLFPAWILKCKTMTTDKNYMLVGNLTEREEIVFDKTGVTMTQIQYPMAVHEYPDVVLDSALACSNTFLMTEVGPVTNANPAAVGGIWPDTKWYVVFGNLTTDTVIYNGVNYITGNVIVGVAGVFNIAYTGTASVRPCVSKNKYTAINGGGVTARPDAIVLTDCINSAPNRAFWDYKHPANAHHVKGLWNGEKYRYAILFYDLKGNPYFAQYLGDFTTSYQDLMTNGIMFNQVYDATGRQMSYLNQTGVRIGGIRIDRTELEKISGFSIVRAERDVRIMTQGLIMQTGLDGGTDVKPLPWADVQVAGTPVDDYGGDAVTYFSGICPDLLVNMPVDGEITNNMIEEACWLGPINYPAGARTKVVSIYATPVDYQMAETKYFGALARDPVRARQSQRVTALGLPNEAGLITNFGQVGISFNNGSLRTNSGVNNALVETSCLGGANPVALPGPGEADGGRRMAIKTGGSFGLYNAAGTNYSDRTLASANKLVGNFVLEKPVQYGGTGASALANTLYVQCGHFQPITSQFIIDNNNTNNVNTYTYVTVNDIDVWGGDAYTCLVDYGHTLYNSTKTNPLSWGFKFPCQSNTNYALRRGRTIMNNRMHLPFGGNGVAYNDPTGPGATVRLEGFEYNPGYSSDNTLIQYPALPVNYVSSGTFKTRIRFAGPKIIGELENSFRTFLTNDYHDLGVQYGEINNIRERDTRVIVWQNKSVVTVPILERQLLSASAGADTTIGTGGVVDRFDAITSAYGNQHQHGLTETDFGFVWFDMRKKAFMVFDINAGVIEESKIGGMKGFFDEVFLENLGVNKEAIVLNSPTFANTSDRPLVGVGIVGVYDPKLKMTYLTFKFNKTGALISDGIEEYPAPIAQDFTIGYYHVDKMFIGFFDMNAANMHNHNQSVLMVNRPSNPTKYYGEFMNSTDFVVGDVVGDLGVEYICIADVTITSYNPAAATNPAYAGSVYWQVVNYSNDIWVLNQPTTLAQSVAPDYLYNKFFGKVVNNEVQFVINPPNPPSAFAVKNVEQVGVNVNFTDIYYSANSQSAADNSITGTDRNYLYIDDRLTSNLPLSPTGEITSNYLLVRGVKKNWTSNPTVLTAAVKILQRFVSYFAFKR